MENVDADFIVRASIGLLVITARFDPVNLLLFNEVMRRRPQSRTGAGLRLALHVAVILAVSAFAGKERLEAMGIDPAAFGAVGGIGGRSAESALRSAWRADEPEPECEAASFIADDLARPPLWDAEPVLEYLHGSASPRRAYRFPRLISRSASISSSSSATIRFRRSPARGP